MITLIQSGQYQLSDTKHGTKLLQLNRKTYAWIEAPRIGSLLIYSAAAHAISELLSEGSYNLYRVVDEPHLSDQLHLELEAGNNVWQGYLLFTGLPTRTDSRKRIQSTREVITNNPAYSVRDASVLHHTGLS